jgi:regulatory protein
LPMPFKKTLSPEQALQKARHYCAYQERSHSEVKEKLYALGLFRNQVDITLAALIEDNYLNEERFARQFAGGKFRMKHWGRVKIKYALKQKQVSEYCIKKGLSEIDESDYAVTLEKLASDRWESLSSEPNLFIKLRKTKDYLLEKGYEPQLISEQLRILQNK